MKKGGGEKGVLKEIRELLFNITLTVTIRKEFLQSKREK